LFIGLFAARHPWLWAVLLTLPIFAWFVRTKTRAVQSLVVVFLDKFAEARGLRRLDQQVDKPKPQASTPVRSVFSAPERPAKEPPPAA